MTSHAMRDLEVQIANTRSATTEQWFHSKLGRGFGASAEPTNPSTGDTSALLLSNPSGTGTSAVVSAVIGNAAAQSYVRLFNSFEGDPSGTGTEVTVENDLLDTQKPDNVVTVESDPTYSPTARHGSAIVGGGSGAGSASGVADLLPVIVEPDREIIVEVEKIGTGGEEVALSFDWFEVPQVFSEENARFDPLEAYQ